jgi:UDP-glucose:(heptosyl)LPS alpha-1,3-glucosyltransferase
MQLALSFKYFPPSAACSATLCVSLDCQARGHVIRVYTPIWEGEGAGGFRVVVGASQGAV